MAIEPSVVLRTSSRRVVVVPERLPVLLLVLSWVSGWWCWSTGAG